MELPVGRGAAAAFIAKSGALRSRFVLLDVGARDGIHPRWHPFEEAMEVYGFDPIADVTAPNERHHYFKIAIGDCDGEALFCVPDNPYEAMISPKGTHKVPLAKLDTLWGEQPLPCADFIKIDCEGHEPEVLAGAERYLSASNILGADIETSFHISPAVPHSHFAAINAPMAQNRLLVAEFAFGPARDMMPWNGTCNSLFARHLTLERSHPELFSLRAPDSSPSSDTVLKLIAVLDIYDLVGPARNVLLKFRSTLDPIIDVETLSRKLDAQHDTEIPAAEVIQPTAGIERLFPHLGLGLWMTTKRLLRR